MDEVISIPQISIFRPDDVGCRDEFYTVQETYKALKIVHTKRLFSRMNVL